MGPTCAFAVSTKGEALTAHWRRRSRRGLAAAITCALTGTVLASAATPARAEGAEQIINGTFDSGSMAPWWSTGNVPAGVVAGELCAEVPGNQANPWDAIVGQNDIALIDGEDYRLSFTARASRAVTPRAIVGRNAPPFDTWSDNHPAVGAAPQTYEYFFTASESLSIAQVAFQVGAQGADPYTFCIDNVSLQGGVVKPPYIPDTGPRVRVNQVGYLPKGPKNATLVTEATAAVPWELRNSAGAAVARGTSRPAGTERTSGLNVHTINFDRYTVAGTGYTLVADGQTSHPFDLSAAAYDKLRVDALSVYYPWRSGIAIDAAIAPGYERPAGHLGVAPNQGDISVPCAPGTCDYSLDVSGGWYDAADHGKYVVNGGISVHQVMSNFERGKVARTAQTDKTADGTLRIPESNNDVPDVLDEARWEMEFLLKMQVPAGKPLAGMVHHKIHDAEWTGLPLFPHLDPQPRYLQPPSTAATLNLAATAAQAARIFTPYDPAFSARALAAAQTAWRAALANPAIYAPAGGVGGGPYNDDNVTDEFYWAAAELYITTGARQYADHVLASPLHTADVWRERGFDWGNVAQLGRLELAAIPNNLPGRAQVRKSVVDGAKKYLAVQKASPWALAYAPSNNVFDWGSNNLVLNNLIVIASAFDITNEAIYRDAVIEGMDYILGRNALNQSYVTGYGETNSHAQHSRWFANSVNADMPPPPVGSLAGGPNSDAGTWDPVAADKLVNCPATPQFCYIDDIGSWSTNEIAINWGSTLSWVAGFIADQDNGGATPSTGSCDVNYAKIALPGGTFVGVATVTNKSGRTIDNYRLEYAFIGGQRLDGVLGAAYRQDGATVTLSGGRLRNHQTAVIAFVGSNVGGLANPVPGLFRLNGAAC
jgi:endoglucanase